MLVEELESVCGKRRIHTIDIGGGLSTDFERAPEPDADFGYNKYRRELELVAPGSTTSTLFFRGKMGGMVIGQKLKFK